MSKRFVIFTLLIAAAVVFGTSAVTQATSAFGGGNRPSANGHGNITLSGELRTFSFTANTRNDGSVTGSVQLQARQADNTLHGDINCLKVVGNIAVMSGPILNSADPAFNGWTGIFRVQDNGEGANASGDLMSLYALVPPTSTLNCNSIGPLTMLAVEGGNVQVKP